MLVDNSGPTFVFDKKTTEAIEAGKNRVTLLQAEEIRYSRLINDLKAEIVKLEAERADKTEQVGRLTGSIEKLSSEEVSTRAVLEQVGEEYKFLIKDIEIQKAAVADIEAKVSERELVVTAKEKALNDREASLLKKETLLVKDKETFEEKKSLIKELLPKL